MNPGMIAPKNIVVMKTISNTELFTIETASYPPSKVKIKANATDPRIIPATVIIKSS